MDKFLKFKRGNLIYKYHLNIGTKPDEIINYLPLMNKDKLYFVFFNYFCDWYRLNSFEVNKASQIMENCFQSSNSVSDFLKNLFFYINKPKLVIYE